MAAWIAILIAGGVGGIGHAVLTCELTRFHKFKTTSTASPTRRSTATMCTSAPITA
jgi:hypothetical protein